LLRPYKTCQDKSETNKSQIELLFTSYFEKKSAEAIKTIEKNRIVPNLFDRAEVFIEPGQGFLDEFGSWGDMVCLVELQLLVFVRGS